MMDPSQSPSSGDTCENCEPKVPVASDPSDAKAMEDKGAVNDTPTSDIPIPPLPESHLTQVADTLVLVMFVVGIYAQIFSLFLYAFGSSA